MNTTAKMIIGITVAAAAGAAIGMLMAPEKGTDLRKKIKAGASDLLKEFSTLLSTGKGLASDFKSKIQPTLEELNAEHVELGV